jgi:hypothetical protein
MEMRRFEAEVAKYREESQTELPRAGTEVVEHREE